MAEINWGLLDTNLPERIGQTFIDAPAKARANELQQMAYDDAIQKRSDSNKLRSILGQYGGDTNQAATEAMKAGMWEPALKMRKDAAEASKAKVSLSLEKANLIGMKAARIMASPDIQTVQQALAEYQQETGDDQTQTVAQFAALGGDPQKIKQLAASYALKAKDMLPHLSQFSSGDVNQLITRDPMSGAVLSNTAIPKTREESAAEGAQAKSLLNVLAPGKFNVATGENGDWSVIPVSGGVGVNPDGSFAQPLQLDGNRLKSLGLTPEQAEMLTGMLSSGNKDAIKQATKQMLGAAFPKQASPSGDYSAFLQEKRAGELPAGMTFFEYKKQLAQAGAVTMNNYGTPMPAINTATGEPVFMQPSKSGGAPSVIKGFAPPKQSEAQAGANSKADTALASLQMVDDRVTSLINHPGLPKITGLIGAIPNIPGSQASDAQAILDGIKANAAIQAMNDMRAASKTGGAVGQVTEAEWPKLENSIALLSKTQGTSAFAGALKQFQAQIRASMARIEKAQNAGQYGHGNQSAPKPGQTPAGKAKFLGFE